MTEAVKYRKKPVVIEAMQVPDERDEDANDALSEWVGEDLYLDSDNELQIITLEGDMHASAGDWIIRGIAGEFYPCRDDIFRQTYEVVSE